MKKILLSLAATAALAAAAAPAAAQPYGWDRGDYRNNYAFSGQQRLTSYVESLDWKIRNAAQERRISWQDARQLREELRRVQPLAWRVEHNRATPGERQRLDRTVQRIEFALTRHARRDRDYDRRNERDYGYGYGDSYRR